MAHLRGASAGAWCGVWNTRRHVGHSPTCGTLPKRGTSRCAPGAFSLTTLFFRSPRAQKGVWCARRVNLCQSTMATVRPALLHRNFEAALREASVGVFARIRVIPEICILHLNFSTSREQSDNCPETEQHRSTKQAAKNKLPQIWQRFLRTDVFLKKECAGGT